MRRAASRTHLTNDRPHSRLTAGLSAAFLALVGAGCADEAVGPRPMPSTASYAKPTAPANLALAFRTNRDGDDEIYGMRSNGAQPTNLSKNPFDPQNPGGQFDGDFAWSPDGTKIAFWTTRDLNAEIYVMNADGSGAVNVSNHPLDDRYPVWSRDGSKLAFVRGNQLADPSSLEIFVMNADGSNQVNVSNNPGFDLEPVFSPDGTKLLFRERADGGSNVMLVDVNGANLTRLTDTPGASNFLASWSPNGSRIVFVSSRDDLVNGDLQVYVMDADGGNQTRLTNASNNTRPVWSPDGTRIAFDSFRTGNDEIYVMNADGSGQTNLTNHPNSDGSPRWSPDGSKIAFVRRVAANNNDVFIMNANGSKQTNLTNNPANDTSPGWRP